MGAVKHLYWDYINSEYYDDKFQHQNPDKKKYQSSFVQTKKDNKRKGVNINEDGRLRRE